MNILFCEFSGHDLRYFDRTGRIDFPNPDVSQSSAKYVDKLQPLTDQVNSDTPIGCAFLSFIRQMLAHDPNERLTAREALSHPYISGTFI